MDWGGCGGGGDQRRPKRKQGSLLFICAPHAGVAALSVAAHAVWPGWPPGLSWPQPLLPLSPLLALSPPEGQNMPVFPAVTVSRALGSASVGLWIQSQSGNSNLLSLLTHLYLMSC